MDHGGKRCYASQMKTATRGLQGWKTWHTLVY